MSPMKTFHQMMGRAMPHFLFIESEKSSRMTFKESDEGWDRRWLREVVQ